MTNLMMDSQYEFQGFTQKWILLPQTYAVTQAGKHIKKNSN